MKRQTRLARTWDDVPESVREDVRRDSEGDLRRVELIDRADGGYGVVVHPEPIELDVDAQLALVDEPFQEVLRRATPIALPHDDDDELHGPVQGSDAE